MSERIDLPLSDEKVVDLLNRRYDALYEQTLRRFCEVFAVIVTDVAPTLREIQRSIESGINDANRRNVPPTAIGSLPRLLTLCDEISTLCAMYNRLLAAYQDTSP